jgi:hypothetical protein
LAFLTQNKAKLCILKVDRNISFWEKSPNFRRKLSKIAENCDHNIAQSGHPAFEANFWGLAGKEVYEAAASGKARGRDSDLIRGLAALQWFDKKLADKKRRAWGRFLTWVGPQWWTLTPGVNFDPRVNFDARGELGPQEWNLCPRGNVHPSFTPRSQFLTSRVFP